MARTRGTTTQRGYGYPHRQAVKAYRAAYQPGQPCARCGQPIWPGPTSDPWRDIQLGHRDGTGKSQYAGLEHRQCNQLAGARQGGRITSQRRRARKQGRRIMQWQPSREW